MTSGRSSVYSVASTPVCSPRWALVVDAPSRVSSLVDSSELLATSLRSPGIALNYGPRAFVHVRLYAFGVRVVVRVGNIYGLVRPVVPVLDFGPVALPPGFGDVRYLCACWYIVRHFFAGLNASYKNDVPNNATGAQKYNVLGSAILAMPQTRAAPAIERTTASAAFLFVCFMVCFCLFVSFFKCTSVVLCFQIFGVLFLFFFLVLVRWLLLPSLDTTNVQKKPTTPNFRRTFFVRNGFF